MNNNFGYEVYVCKRGETVIYVGEGKLGRHKHCTSGTSHVYELNKFHFRGVNLSVEVVKLFETKKEAQDYEQRLIDKYMPTNNIKGKLSFRDAATEYYELSEQFKVDQDPVIFDRMTSLLSLDGEFKSYVEVLGIEQIKATHFHKTKTRAKYNKAVGIDEKSKAQMKALKSLKIKDNTFYNFAELKEMIKSTYVKLGVNASAKATDIQSTYLVKSTSRNGVRGYLIIGKI